MSNYTYFLSLRSNSKMLGFYPVQDYMILDVKVFQLHFIQGFESKSKEA
jgi:hypothetical protein